MTVGEATPADPPGPEVSVVIPVHNAMPYLTECLDSVFAQSIGAERLEVLAVDDGSTDGSGAELDRYAARHPRLRVTHRDTASGGASLPRNQGLDAATGRFVFFCDADDVLGADALRRMVAAADENDAELVVGRTRGLDGRTTSTRAFRHEPRVDLRRSEVIRSGAPQKLFRRSLLERAKLRFDEDIWFGEDQIFVAEAFLTASGISVVGDYDCYFLRRRADGGNITARPLTAAERTRHTERVMRLVHERAGDAVVRRRMLARYFRYLVSTALLPGLRHPDEEYRRQIWHVCERLHRSYWSAQMAADVSAHAYVLLRCLAHGKRELAREVAVYDPHGTREDDLIEEGRVFRAFPGFRTPGGLPDDAYDVTDRLAARALLESAEWSGDTLTVRGYAHIDWVDTRDPASRLLLRHRKSGRELDLPVVVEPSPGLAERRGHPRDYGSAGWRAVIDPAALAAAPGGRGVWDAFVRVSAQGVVKERRLPRPPEGFRPPGARFLALPGPHGPGTTAVVPYVTQGRCFSVDLGGVLRPVVAGAVAGGAAWRGTALELTAVAWATEVPADLLSADVVLRARRRSPGARPRRFLRLLRSAVVRRRSADLVLPAEVAPLTGAASTDVPAHAHPVAVRCVVDRSRARALLGRRRTVVLRLRQPGRVTDLPLHYRDLPAERGIGRERVAEG